MCRLEPYGLRDPAQSRRNHCSNSTSQTLETMAVARPCDPGRTQEDALSSYIAKTKATETIAPGVLKLRYQRTAIGVET